MGLKHYVNRALHCFTATKPTVVAPVREPASVSLKVSSLLCWTF